MSEKITTQLVVLGSGPGGYSAAFRAADLGLQVVLVERAATLGGVCLNVGCIPSKALLHVARVLTEAEEMQQHGINFGKPSIDLAKVRAWKDKVVSRLTGGLQMMAKQRKVRVIQGEGQFTGANTLKVQGAQQEFEIEFQQAIIAAGSRPVKLPFLPEDPRIMDSTGALELADIPQRMLVIGGGIIGLEMATVYDALGSKISVAEMMSGLMGGLDADIVRPLQKRLAKRYEKIMCSTRVTKVEAKKDGLWVSFEGEAAPAQAERYDKILSAVGRVPNGKLIAAEKAGVQVDERGFIAVDKQQRTNIPHIYAIGDITGNPMLAHKATPEGRLAAEVIAGKKHYWEASVIPSVAYTDPEVAWVGVTESEAKQKGIEYGVGQFPWMASGRALAQGRDEGFTKLIFCKKTNRIIGGSVVGINAGELISEITLAIEMGCDPEDLSLSIHPHPTLAESIALAAEVFEGTITDLYLPK